MRWVVETSLGLVAVTVLMFVAVFMTALSFVTFVLMVRAVVIVLMSVIVGMLVTVIVLVMMPASVIVFSFFCHFLNPQCFSLTPYPSLLTFSLPSLP